jgi:phage-related protein
MRPNEKLSKKLPAVFYRTSSGREPVREWLCAMTKENKIAVGEAIRKAEYGWPVGMPLCRAISGRRGLWEIRAAIAEGIARVLFCEHNGEMILLHGFVKKSRQTPPPALDLATARMKKAYKEQLQ